MTMDFQSAMETFAEAWVAANTKPSSSSSPLTELHGAQSQALALTSRGANKSDHTSSSTPTTTTTTTTTPAAAVASEGGGGGGGGGSSSRDSDRVSPPHSPPDVPTSPPSVKEEFDASVKPLAKSLPVHCVVEAICTLDEGRTTAWRRRTLIETDSFVIIPVRTPFHDLVQTALLQLGYSAESAGAAKGAVVIKNWRALSFEQICDDPLASVGEILGELSSVATLRIQVFRGRPAAMADVKDKLLRFLLVQSHTLLLSSGCPLDEVLLAQICRGSASPEMTDESRKKFDQWWSAQFSPPSASRTHLGPPGKLDHRTPLAVAHDLSVAVGGGHPAMQTVHTQFPTQKTRMRTSFDPELELPKLQRWFADNQHPSRQQIQQYVKELNGLQSRRGRKPLDVNNVVYWFKNARAAQKRAEIRNAVPMANGYTTSYSPTNGSAFLMNDGYLNSERLDYHHHHRLKTQCRRGAPNTSHMSDELSNTASDLDEDDMVDALPSSPVAPLSLTTSRKLDVESPRSSPPIPDAHQPKVKAEEDVAINYHNNNNNKAGSEDEHEVAAHLLRTRSCDSPEMVVDVQPTMLHRAPPNEGLERLAASFPLVPNSMFSHSIMYMSQYIPGLTPHSATSPPASSALTLSALSADERRKRNRTFIDPVTEVPRLEQWFSLNTHPSHNLILKYTDELNCMAYRQKFPRLEPKNVQFWFKNRRAKCKRLKMSLFDNQPAGGGHHFHSDKE